VAESNSTPLAELNAMKFRLSEDAAQVFEAAGEDPYQAVNQANGQSVETFCALLSELERFICDFEEAIELRGAARWWGERLHEAVRAGRATVEQHLTHQYFSEYAIQTDTAHILIENYELARVRAGLRKRAYQGYTFAVLRLLLTRLAHEDTHAHLLKTDYAGLFAELLDRTQRRIELEHPSARKKIKRLPFELTAPIYLKEREERFARRMQRFAINAFLKERYAHDPDRYGLIGVPLFLPPHPEVVKEIERQTRGAVEIKSGFLSTYRRILEEYVESLVTPREEIMAEARRYLQARTRELINLAQACLAGDYRGLRIRERELVWRPGRGMKL
jgi:hypothetical protein